MKNTVRSISIGVALLGSVLAWQWASAEEIAVTLPPGVAIPEAAQPGPAFDVEQATAAYLALLTPEQRARSDAYFEGKYWLQLWQWLYGLGAALLIVFAGWSVRLRDWSKRRSSRPWLQTFLFAVAFFVLLSILTFPLTVYADYFREHQYGSSNLTFGAWFGEQLIGLVMGVTLGSLFITAIYAMVRRVQGTWWAWASAFTLVFLLFVLMITPVFINPAFNDYKPLPEGPVREEILSLAHANQVPAHDVKWFDASKQTKRISAHVAGMFGTTQIALNDNLLDKTSLPEIRAVMAHEMGHYVLNHGLRHAIYFTLVFALGFLILERSMSIVFTRWGAKLGIGERGDPAALPIAIAIFTTYLFLVGPIINQIIYAGEVEADIFALNASREPHGFATVAMRLASYRKLEPGRLEKFLFYDHPSGRDRVEMSMQWLRENQSLFEPKP